MEDIYREQILEHARYPRNYGTLEHPTISHEEYNPLCGDRVRIDLLIEDGVIADVRFSGKGCAISQASASMLTDEIKGMNVERARAFSKDDLLMLIGIPLNKNPTRLKCALLALKALKAGLYGVGSVDVDDA
ncbi:MAG: SUF system NifU family Fe-S cluster assembly protein [Oscillochloridaceae bacterium]|nr:SUF system NifU family Fe-S cluster assembly protein [Chloroflexaceae bacterium]MDW8389869.1 SUF system NifU family Fe-S cluster assembly protein [Oscillochloridaceae bacterium]